MYSSFAYAEELVFELAIIIRKLGGGWQTKVISRVCANNYENIC